MYTSSFTTLYTRVYSNGECNGKPKRSDNLPIIWPACRTEFARPLHNCCSALFIMSYQGSLREVECDESIFPRRATLSPPRPRELKYDSSPSQSPGGHAAVLATPLPRFVARVDGAGDHIGNAAEGAEGAARAVFPTDNVSATPSPTPGFERFATDTGDAFLFSPQSGEIVWDNWAAAVGRYVRTAPSVAHVRFARGADLRLTSSRRVSGACCGTRATQGRGDGDESAAPQLSTVMLVGSTAAIVFLDARLRALGLHWALRLSVLAICVCIGALLEERRRCSIAKAARASGGPARDTTQAVEGEGPVERAARLRNAGTTPYSRIKSTPMPGVADAHVEVPDFAGHSPRSRSRELEEIALQKKEIAATRAQISTLVAAAEMFGTATPLSSPFGGAHDDSVVALRGEVRAPQDYRYISCESCSQCDSLPLTYYVVHFPSRCVRSKRKCCASSANSKRVLRYTTKRPRSSSKRTPRKLTICKTFSCRVLPC